MITIEDELFTLLATALRETYPDIYVANEYVPKPTHFPAVFIEEIDNTTKASTVESGLHERFADVTLRVEVFSSRHIGKRAEAKAIAKFIDDMLISRNFMRRSLTPIPNLNDATVYCVRGMYAYTVDEYNTIYRR